MFYSVIDILDKKVQWEPKRYEKSYIYFLISANDEVVYVGQSVNVHSRVSVHMENKTFKFYSFFECEKGALNELEDMYITMLDPIYNKKLNKYGMYYSLPQISERLSLSQHQVREALRIMQIKSLFSNNYRAIDIDVDIKTIAKIASEVL